ncbi:MAG: deoxynucleoside kinase [Acidobacteria bacterium]|jgi:deoxyadenosine/deoxycytidine kinase|nr:deoxynucleoside kinase [Acidobacteriota bacterium]MCZ6745829.1 deoxynucleoside kinase [Acidobacteriota bacterium]
MKHKYIAVEGAIGVGKSSLVEALASRFDSAKVMESIENPFLVDFYNDRQGAAFQAQLFFLLSRYRQLTDHVQQDLFSRLVIADYVFEKDKIFAYLNLTDDELLIYDKLFSLLEPKVPRPDLVIYLQAGNDVLMSRIRKRRRDLEANLSEKYISEVNRSYNHYFFHYDATPLLVVNTSEIDFVNREEDLEDLIEQIRAMEKGVQYYVPLGSRV